MKIKFFARLFVLTFVAIFTLINAPDANSADDTDQYCDDSQIVAADQYYLFSEHTLSQGFTPATNTLSEVGVAIAMGADNPKTVTLEIRKITGGDTLVASKSVSGSVQLITWIQFLFDNVSLETTNQYRLSVTTSSTTAHMVYSTASCYASGTAYVDGGSHADKDFGFYTLGHNVAAPSDSVAQQSTDSSDVMSTATTQSIAKPTKATGEFDSSVNAVKLSWTKSSADDIDGYKIYRSANKTKGYAKIGQVDKKTFEYLDQSEIVPGTFYYYIRAHKAKEESESSNLVTVEVPQIMADARADQEITQDNNALEQELSLWKKITGPYFIYTLGISAILELILCLIFYRITRKRLSKIL